MSKQLCKVWNEGPVTLSERFNGREIHIEPGEFVEMKRGDAVAFKSQFKPLVHDGEMNPIDASIKKVRVEGLYPAGGVAASNDLVDHATGQVAKTPEELAALQKASAHMLTDESKDLLAEKEKSSALMDENQALKAQLAQAQAAAGKRSPGRPRKAKDEPQGEPNS